MTQARQVRTVPWAIETPAQKVMRRLRQLAGRSAFVRVGPYSLEVPPDRAWAFFSDGEYFERNVVYWIEKLLVATPERVFYDIGANNGYYSLLLAPRAAHVCAFEPVSRTYAVLARNIERNGASNVTAYQLGVSDRQGSALIHLYRSRFFAFTSGSSSLWSDTKLRPAGQETISLVTLDSLARERRLPPPSLIKIDIEGGELYALRGARGLLRAHHPIIISEFTELDDLQDIGYTRAEQLAFLRDLGYAVYGLSADVTDSHAYPLDRFGETTIQNIIALPAGMEYVVNR